MYQKLTPTYEMDTDVYENALDFAFSEPDIHNIAIAGAYSSGKSSLIRSYVKKHRSKVYYVSLAYFDGDKPDEEDVIEKKIINQLIQQAPKDTVNEAGFRVREKTNLVKRVIPTIAISLFILLFFILSKFSYICDLFFPHDDYFILSSRWLFIGIIAAATMFLICGGHYIIKRFIHDNSIKAIAVKGNEIQLSNSENSYFDMHLDEILFVLSNVKVDGIVFEDLDRIDSVEIYERLREINTLVNYRKSEGEKPVRFFYLLRDDIFKDNKDRTKFFDFIIPVIPVIDSSNSYDKIKEDLLKSNKYKDINDSFLRGVCIYIDDYRILKNIINEFIIYEEKLNIVNLDLTKLMALIIYKNIFPKDFTELQFNRGLVYSVIKSKRVLIEECTEELRERELAVEDRIRKSEEELLDDLDELKYLEQGMRQLDQSKYFNYINSDSKAIRKKNIEDKNASARNKLIAEKNRIVHE